MKLFLIILISVFSFLNSNAQNLSVATSSRPNFPNRNLWDKIPKKYLRAENGGETTIKFVGNGDIQKSISDGEGIQANTGLGVIFHRRWKEARLIQNIEFDFVVNVASTSDTVKSQIENNVLLNRRDFGTYILNPTSSRQAANFNFNAYFGDYDKYLWAKIISGIHTRFTASNSVWNYDTKNVNLAGFLFRAGIFHDFMPDEIRYDKDYSITAGINYSFRGVFGDLKSATNNDLRKSFLGTETTKYRGFEINLGFRLQNIRAEVQIPMFNPKNSQVPGLTNTQFVTSIRFVGGFPIVLKNRTDENTDDN